jgi:hypothetical protein
MTSLKDIEQRQPKYWSGDGLPQLATGVGWLLWGGVYLIGLSLLEKRSYRVYWAIVTGLVLLWGIAVQLAMGKLKQRMTYPRVSYAGMPIGGHGILRHIAGPLLLGVMTLSLIGFRVDLGSYGPFLAGGLIALAIAEPAMGPASKHHVEVLYWGFLLELALWLAMLLQFRDKAGNNAAVYWTLVCMGVVGIVFGAVRLRRFLRENPKPAETET